MPLTRYRVLAIIMALATLDTAYRYLDFAARGRKGDLVVVAVEQFGGGLGVWLLLPLVFWAADHNRLARYALMAPFFSVLHTSWNWAFRATLLPLLGRPPYDYGLMPQRYWMEFPSDLIALAIVAVLRRQYLAWRRHQALERDLATARVELLTRQLQPHFLFNALNTVSALMYEDVAKADRVLSRLCEFLRATTALREETFIPLAQEIELLRGYAAVMEARWEDQLSIDIQCEQSLRDFLVPPLLLQPLVENAVTHGRDPAGAARIRVSCARHGAVVALAVSNTRAWQGKGSDGFGIAAVRQRLQLAYGSRATFEIIARQNETIAAVNIRSN
jgi:hypothetical protein